MSRLHLTFACGSHTLAGTLDTAPGTTGLLIVSGGNEVRSGAFGGDASLARAISQSGFPVFRFDRRGVGDSEGENRGFRHSAKDIASARDAFKALSPDVERVVAFGNCDAASALMLGDGVGFDGLVLSNPWTLDDEAEEADGAASHLPPSAVRNRYAQKLKDPAELKRLLTGGVNLGKLARGLFQASRGSAPAPSGLLEEMRLGFEEFSGPVSLLLAGADRTAQVFEEGWDAADPRIARCPGAGHAFVEFEHRAWLKDQILAALRA